MVSFTDREVSLQHNMVYQRTDHSLDTTVNIFREVTAAQCYSPSAAQVVGNTLVTSSITLFQLTIAQFVCGRSLAGDDKYLWRSLMSFLGSLFGIPFPSKIRGRLQTRMEKVVGWLFTQC